MVDLGGRPYSHLNIPFETKEIEDLNVENIPHFFESLAQASKSNIHLELLYGSNDHHKFETIIKALALALREACTIDPRMKGIPSTKGVI